MLETQVDLGRLEREVAELRRQVLELRSEREHRRWRAELRQMMLCALLCSIVLDFFIVAIVRHVR